MTDKSHMRQAVPHIERAQNSLEMLRMFVENKGRLGLTRRVPQYYNSLVDSVIELQKLLLTDDEYVAMFGDSIKDVSKSREYQYQVNTNKKGETFLALDALLPVKRMRRRVLMSKGKAAPTIWDGGRRV